MAAIKEKRKRVVVFRQAIRSGKHIARLHGDFRFPALPGGVASGLVDHLARGHLNQPAPGISRDPILWPLYGGREQCLLYGVLCCCEVAVPARHPLLKAKPLTLEKLAEYPIVTYDFAFANRSLVQKAFEARGLKPHVVLSAQDSDVIKTYVELGLGVGILAKMAFDPQRDRALRAIDASHLFESSTTRLGIKRNAYLRRYAYEFIELFAPHLPRAVVERTVTGEEGSRYEL